MTSSKESDFGPELEIWAWGILAILYVSKYKNTCECKLMGDNTTIFMRWMTEMR